jgi:hypothetical protein
MRENSPIRLIKPESCLANTTRGFVDLPVLFQADILQCRSSCESTVPKVDDLLRLSKQQKEVYFNEYSIRPSGRHQRA